MMGVLGRIAREPLVQFLVVGALVVTLASVRGARAPEPTHERIVVDRERIAQLEDLVTRNWRRTPTAADMERVIEAYVREEILAREALKLGLDEDDSIIRQRLAQKMEFLLEPPPAALEASEAALAAHLADNIARYQAEPRVAFTQVYLSPQVHGAAMADDAAAIRAALENGADPAALSDPTLLPGDVEETALGNVRRIFGADFAEAVMTLPEGTWSEPVPSAYGSHLVRVASRRQPPPPTLETVREAVARDLRAKTQHDYIDARYRELRAAYEVEIEPVDAAPAPAPTNDADADTDDDEAGG